MDRAALQRAPTLTLQKRETARTQEGTGTGLFSKQLVKNGRARGRSRAHTPREEGGVKKK